MTSVIVEYVALGMLVFNTAAAVHYWKEITEVQQQGAVIASAFCWLVAFMAAIIGRIDVGRCHQR